MKYIVTDEALLSCYNKHFDTIRGFCFSGDATLLKEYVQEVLEFIIEQGNTSALTNFKESITSREWLALSAIIQEIGQEGNISVVKMVQKAGVSRPVFDNLLTKLKNYEVAEIANQGVKGTNIKFLFEINDILKA